MQFFEDLEQESWLLYSPNFRIKEEKERTIPLVLAGLIEKKKINDLYLILVQTCT